MSVFLTFVASHRTSFEGCNLGFGVKERYVYVVRWGGAIEFKQKGRGGVSSWFDFWCDFRFNYTFLVLDESGDEFVDFITREILDVNQA